MLRLQDVSKSFGTVTAVSSLDLDIRPAETTVLIGPSGCGKSTVLRMMNGLVLPDSGQISWGGQPIGDSNLLEIRRRQGYVIQEGGLFPHMTARENVAVVARYLDWNRSSIESRLSHLAELMRLDVALLDRYPRQLSGGQRQRISLMRALMLDPELLLLDEPLGALDPMIRADLQSDLRSIFADLGKAVVLVTHDLAEAGFFGHQIVLMKDGAAVQIGRMDDFNRTPADPFVTQFVTAQRQTHVWS